MKENYKNMSSEQIKDQIEKLTLLLEQEKTNEAASEQAKLDAEKQDLLLINQMLNVEVSYDEPLDAEKEIKDFEFSEWLKKKDWIFWQNIPLEFVVEKVRTKLTEKKGYFVNFQDFIEISRQYNVPLSSLEFSDSLENDDSIYRTYKVFSIQIKKNKNEKYEEECARREMKLEEYRNQFLLEREQKEKEEKRYEKLIERNILPLLKKY